MQIDPAWAQTLLKASARLTTPAYLPGLLSTHQQVLQWVGAMFTRFTAQELPRVRAWVDAGQRYTITDALVRLAPQTGLTLDQRLALANENPHYCATFNGLTAWCPTFAQHMQHQMLEPLFQALGGAPGAGADYYAFFGNYGYTPFGVHDDTDESLLWHLGPADKTAYVWPRQKYQELTGGTLATTHYAALLPHALRFDLRPGDLLFIPMGDFHILQTNAFSATLGVTLFPQDPLLECSEGLRLFAHDAASLARHSEQVISLSQLSQLRRLSVRSNGGVITPPNLRLLASNAPDDWQLAHSTLHAHPSWPLLRMPMGGREALLVRRRAIWSRPNPLFAALCDLFRHHQAVPYRQLAQHLPQGLQAEAIADTVRAIHRLGGLQIEPA